MMRKRFRITSSLAFPILLLLGLAMGRFLLHAGEPATIIPAPEVDSPLEASEAQTAVFAGGCFWGIQGVYQHVEGVQLALSGYAGGSEHDARYELVSRGGTDHAEAVQVMYDPAVVSYGKLLQIFFSVGHDPTQLNRQGPDTGPQYRSHIFYTDDEQKKIAEAYIQQLNEAGVYDRPIVTRLDPLEKFYPAEDYHQDFLLENPRHRYIVINDLPKIENLKDIFPEEYRDEPVRSR